MSLADSSSLAFLVHVVDDDAAVRHSVRFLLECHGFLVRTYESGAELLAAGGAPGRGCLVLDYHLPKIDGLGVLERLRAERIDLPAILVTAGLDPVIARRAAEVGVVAVVEKPFAGDALLDAIATALAAGGR